MEVGGADKRGRNRTYPLLNFETIMTGPKDSSRAMNMWSCTSVNTVGSKKNPADTTSRDIMWADHGPQTTGGTGPTCPLHLPPSTHQGGALLDATLTVFHKLVQVGFVVLRPVVCGAVQRVPDLHLLHLVHLEHIRRHFQSSGRNPGDPSMTGSADLTCPSPRPTCPCPGPTCAGPTCASPCPTCAGPTCTGPT